MWTMEYRSIGVAVIFLLVPTLHAGRLSETTKQIDQNDDKQLRGTARQQATPQHSMANFMNTIVTNGLALSASIGAGVRVDRGDIPSGGNPNEQNPSSSNVWDRYISGRYHVGLNLHHGNNRQGHEGLAQHIDGGIPVSTVEDTNRLEVHTEPTTEKPSFWERVRKYFTSSPTTEPSEPDPNERNCTGGTPTSAGWLDCPDMTLGGNAFTRWYNRYFMKDEPRVQQHNWPLHATNSSAESMALNTIGKFFAVYKSPAVLDQLNSTGGQELRKKTESLRSTMKHFLADKISLYVTGNTTNEQFLHKLVRRSLLQGVTNGTEQAEDDKEVTAALAAIFSIEKIRSWFPGIETLKQSIRHAPNLESESAYDNWSKQYVAEVIAKHRTAQLKGPYLT